MHNRPSVAVGAWADVARAKRVHAASTRPGGHPALEELHGAREAPVAALHPRRHQQLEQLDRTPLTRRDSERLFGVSKARAATLMEMFGAEMTGN